MSLSAIASLSEHAAMAVDQDIADAIETIVRDRFPEEIASVRVTKGTDPEGDSILNITVVLERAHLLDPQKTTGIARRVRHMLLGRNQDSFPIFAFISKSDDQKRLKAEAA
jgi:hypothetical protein